MKNILPVIFMSACVAIATYAMASFPSRRLSTYPTPTVNIPTNIVNILSPTVPNYNTDFLVTATPTPPATQITPSVPTYQNTQENATHEFVYIAPTDAYKEPTLYTSTETPTITVYNTLSANAETPTESETVPQEYLFSYTLDDMWDQVVAFGLDSRVSNCSYPLAVPFVTWEMAYQAAGIQTSDRTYTEIKMESQVISNIVAQGGGYFPTVGIVQIQEETVKNKLIELWGNHRIRVCKDINGKPALYDVGVQEFLDWLTTFILVS